MRLLICLLYFVSSSVLAEAYCGLRDPIATISQLYPDYTHFRSVVRTVDMTTRQKVSKKLPGMPLHFGELGRHTLYVIKKNEQTLGLVHVRSEQSQWGLVEIAWSISMDMKVNDFAFQRCRSRDRSYFESTAFKTHYFNKDIKQLMTYFNFEQDKVTTEYAQLAEHSADLADVILRCALKTLLVTEIVWQEELAALNSTPL